MIRPGLVSITFRKLSPETIVDLVKTAGLAGIEWGGDVHVPHGDVARAREVRRMTEDAGLAVAAYGSYYRLAASESDGLSFRAILDSAVALGAPTIRVWAGTKASADADAAQRSHVRDDALRIAALARTADLRVAYEYHGGTLTDTDASARQLLSDAAPPNLRCYWQPAVGWTAAARLESLRAVLPRLEHLHVFSWRTGPDGKTERLPLADGAEDWRRYLAAARTADGDRYALLEFVRDDDPARFPAEAATLKEWLNELSS